MSQSTIWQRTSQSLGLTSCRCGWLVGVAHVERWLWQNHTTAQTDRLSLKSASESSYLYCVAQTKPPVYYCKKVRVTANVVQAIHDGDCISASAIEEYLPTWTPQGSICICPYLFSYEAFHKFTQVRSYPASVHHISHFLEFLFSSNSLPTWPKPKLHDHLQSLSLKVSIVLMLWSAPECS